MSGLIKGVSIARCAEILGVTRQHLYRVLKGERQSVSLTSRYQKLVAQLERGQEPQSTGRKKASSKGKIVLFPPQA